MNAFLIVHSRSPFLILSTHETMDEALEDELLDMGLETFLVFEVPLPQIRRRYGELYERVSGNLDSDGSMEILDANGMTVMENIDPDDLRRVHTHDAGKGSSRPGTSPNR